LDILSANCLPVSSFALTDSSTQVIKAFQNPVWAEMARNRLNEIKMLTKDATV